MTNEIKDPNFGRCLSINNGLVELRVTLDFGPRVIYCACVGMENMFCEDPKKATLGEKYDLYEDQLILYGGHRLWISPEILPRCYHPDNLPVTYEEIEGGARFIAEVEKHNQIQKSMTITLAPDAPIVSLVHSIRNVGPWDIQLSPWSITMMAAGGLEVMPMPNRIANQLPNRNFTFWDYSELSDSRVYFGLDYITLSQDSAKTNPFKLGYNNEAGWAAYFNKGQVFMKYFEPVLGGLYPDNGCCYETYTNGDMLEMETLGEVMELEPDDFVTLEEEWELYTTDKPTDPRNEAEIKAALSKWIS
jgi:hypothetical protein